ncbi:hypothetical protein T12_7572 [Trichinella patagoniensis]|nr:hypothetical protein T12_7572 [Trichinella patagoniensis]
MFNNECYVSSDDQPIGRAKLFSDHWTGFSDLPTKISALHYPSIGRRPNTNFQFGLSLIICPIKKFHSRAVSTTIRFSCALWTLDPTDKRFMGEYYTCGFCPSNNTMINVLLGDQNAAINPKWGGLREARLKNNVHFLLGRANIYGM